MRNCHSTSQHFVVGHAIITGCTHINASPGYFWQLWPVDTNAAASWSSVVKGCHSSNGYLGDRGGAGIFYLTACIFDNPDYLDDLSGGAKVWEDGAWLP